VGFNDDFFDSLQEKGQRQLIFYESKNWKEKITKAVFV